MKKIQIYLLFAILVLIAAGSSHYFWKQKKIKDDTDVIDRYVVDSFKNAKIPKR